MERRTRNQDGGRRELVEAPADQRSLERLHGLRRQTAIVLQRLLEDDSPIVAAHHAEQGQRELQRDL